MIIVYIIICNFFLCSYSVFLLFLYVQSCTLHWVAIEQLPQSQQFFKNMKKTLSIISAVCIGIASVGFLLITHIFEKRIKRLKEMTDKIISKQKVTKDYLYEANHSRHTLLLLNDHFDILLKVMQNDKGCFAEREKRLISVSSGCAINALNAALSAEFINQTFYNTELEKAKKSVDQSYHFEIYNRYREKAGEGTKKLDAKRLENQRTIEKLNVCKNVLLSLCFLFQATGLTIAIYSISAND